MFAGQVLVLCLSKFLQFSSMSLSNVRLLFSEWCIHNQSLTKFGFEGCWLGAYIPSNLPGPHTRRTKQRRNGSTNHWNAVWWRGPAHKPFTHLLQCKSIDNLIFAHNPLLLFMLVFKSYPSVVHRKFTTAPANAHHAFNSILQTAERATSRCLWRVVCQYIRARPWQ